MEDTLPPPRLEDAVETGISSCFRKVETLQRMHVLPSYIGRVSEGILSILNAQVLRYSKAYGGVVLAYSKPTILNSQGLIVDEQPHIHFSVRVSLYLFKPCVNAVLRGTVNSISTAHVGCLVHNCFNASVFAPVGEHSTRTTNGLFSKQLHVGSQIWFRVTRLDTTDVLFIQGEYVGAVGETDDGTVAEPLCSVMEVEDNMALDKGRKKKKIFDQERPVEATQIEDSRDKIEAQREDVCTKTRKDFIAADNGLTKPKKSGKKNRKSHDSEGITSVEQLHVVDSCIHDTKKRKRRGQEEGVSGEEGAPAKKRKLHS